MWNAASSVGLSLHMWNLSLSLLSVFAKDAGFVYESLRNETNRIFWDFWSYETNPRNESLENRPTKRIHDTNLWKFRSRNESTKRIFKVRIRESGFANPPAWICKDSFRAIVLRIRQDSWGFVGFVKTARIFESSGHETNPRFKSLRIGLTNPDSRICEVRIRDTIRNESFWSQDSWLRYETNPWIRETNPRFYESLIRIPHP
jgi:hypothetical protein